MSNSNSSSPPGSASPPPAGGNGDNDPNIKKVREAMAMILRNMDSDLSRLIVMASISMKYENVLEKATVCSDLMYMRDMLASISKLKSPTDKTAHGYTAAEVISHLQKHGYIIKQ